MFHVTTIAAPSGSIFTYTPTDAGVEVHNGSGVLLDTMTREEAWHSIRNLLRAGWRNV